MSQLCNSYAGDSVSHSRCSAEQTLQTHMPYQTFLEMQKSMADRLYHIILWGPSSFDLSNAHERRTYFVP